MSASDSECIILDSDNYEGGNYPSWNSARKGEAAEWGFNGSRGTILRSELGALMWVAWIARPGAIYDESSAAKTASEGQVIDSLVGNEDIPEREEKEDSQKERMISGTCQVSESFTSKSTECQ